MPQTHTVRLARPVPTTLFFVSALFAVSAAMAQQGEHDSIELREVVVTATRSLEPVETLGSAVTVITAEELKSSGVDTVLEALRRVPGLDVVQSGGPGRTTSVFLRGHDPDQTKILIDGLRFNGNMSASYDFSNLPVANIERIEVLRGPQSALYGGDAIGGVVHIITKRGQEGLHGEMSTAVGSNDYGSGTLSLSGGNEVGDFSLAYSYKQFEGISAADEAAGNREIDGWNNHWLSARFGLNFLDDGRADLSVTAGVEEGDLDGGPGAGGDDPNFVQERDSASAMLQLSKPISDWYTQSFHLGLVEQRFEGKDPDTAWNNYTWDEKTTAAGFKTDFFPWAGDALTIGYDFERQSADQKGTVLDRTVDLNSVYLQNHWSGDVFSFTVGLRHDDHEISGEETTYRLAMSAKCPDLDTRAHASLGTGFRAPTLSGLYSPWGGSPNLTAETSESFDIGIVQPLWNENVVAQVTYFHSDLENLIEWRPIAPGSFTHNPINVAAAKIQGVETTLRLSPLSSLDLVASYTHTDHEDVETGADLTRRPRHSSSLSAIYRHSDALDFNMILLHVGSRHDAGTKLDAYTRVDLAAAYEVNEHVEVFGRIENVGDASYTEAAGYGAPGRWGLVGIRCGF